MVTVKLDWLAFTWKSSEYFQADEFDKFMAAFPELASFYDEGCMIRDMGSKMFYDHVLMFNEMCMISYKTEQFSGQRANVNMGVNVSIPAHGLEWFCDLMGYNTEDASSIFQDLVKRGCKMSRIDIAYDDYLKFFTPKDYGKFFLNNQIITNFRKCRFVCSGGDDQGTFYFGTRKTGKMLRIYDKAYESNGSIDAIRYEFELHGEHCQAYVDYILEQGCFPNLHSALDPFICKIVSEGEKHNNKSARITIPEWDLFINALEPSLTQSSEPVQVTKSKDTQDKLVRKTAWFRQYLLPSLRSLIDIYGWDSVMNCVMNSPVCHEHDILQTLYMSGSARYRAQLDEGTALGRDWFDFWN